MTKSKEIIESYGFVLINEDESGEVVEYKYPDKNEYYRILLVDKVCKTKIGEEHVKGEDGDIKMPIYRTHRRTSFMVNTRRFAHSSRPLSQLEKWLRNEGFRKSKKKVAAKK